MKQKAKVNVNNEKILCKVIGQSIKYNHVILNTVKKNIQQL